MTPLAYRLDVFFFTKVSSNQHMHCIISHISLHITYMQYCSRYGKLVQAHCYVSVWRDIRLLFGEFTQQTSESSRKAQKDMNELPVLIVDNTVYWPLTLLVLCLEKFLHKKFQPGGDKSDGSGEGSITKTIPYSHLCMYCLRFTSLESSKRTLYLLTTWGTLMSTYVSLYSCGTRKSLVILLAVHTFLSVNMKLSNPQWTCGYQGKMIHARDLTGLLKKWWKILMTLLLLVFTSLTSYQVPVFTE